MKLHFIGTCAGTEPMPNRRHACTAVEIAGKLYWFDAGEGCSITGHLMGLDLTRIKKIMISHTHMDHIGGLAPLLWQMKKISYIIDRFPEPVELYLPNEDTARALYTLLCTTESAFCKRFEITWKDVQDGLLFDEEGVRVTALHNYHLEGRPEGGIPAFFNDPPRWRSFGYRLEAEGKSLVYSGDIKQFRELDDLIGDGCDGLIIETGHHGVDAVYQYVKDRNVKNVFFSHNGREILNNPEASRQKVAVLFGEHGLICEDGTTVEL